MITMMSDYVHIDDAHSNPWVESEDYDEKRRSEEAFENEQALLHQEWEQQSLLIDQLNLEVQTLRRVTIELISEKDRIINEMERDKQTWFLNESKDKTDLRAKIQQKRLDALRRFLADVVNNKCPFEE